MQAPGPARKPINVAEIMRAEILLLIAGFLTLFAGVGFQWRGGGYYGYVGGPSVLATEIIIGLLMIYSAIVSLGYITILRELVPAIPVSAVCGVILFFFNVEVLGRWWSHWSVVVGLIAGIISLLAAFVGYFKPAFARAA